MKIRTLALILAAALTVTSVEGTAVMASAAEFTSEAVEETEAELETAPEDSADVAVLSDQGDSSELNEIEISDSESQDSDSAEEQIDVFEETQDGADEEGIEITDEEALTDADAENEETNIEVFSLKRRSCTERSSGFLRRENAGMSSEKEVRILLAEYLRFPG